MRIRNGQELIIECDDCLPIDSTPAAVTISNVAGMDYKQIDAITESHGFVKVESEQGFVINTYCPECAEERGL